MHGSWRVPLVAAVTLLLGGAGATVFAQQEEQQRERGGAASARSERGVDEAGRQPGRTEQPSRTGERTGERDADRRNPSDVTREPQRQPRGDAAGPGERMRSRNDALLAGILIVENEGEVALSQLGHQQGQDPEVKQFAQEMIQAHQAMIEKLQRFAGPQVARRPAARTGGAVVDPPARPSVRPGRDAARDGEEESRGNPETDRPEREGAKTRPDGAAGTPQVQDVSREIATTAVAQVSTDRADDSAPATAGQNANVKNRDRAESRAGKDRTGPRDATTEGQIQDRTSTRDPQTEVRATTDLDATEGSGERRNAAGGLNMVMLKQEIGERSQASIRKALQGKQGRDFDLAFMGMQIAAHMHAIDTMEVFANHASPELKQVIHEGVQEAQSHLEKARQIHQRLEGQRGDASRTEARDLKSDQ